MTHACVSFSFPKKIKNSIAYPHGPPTETLPIETQAPTRESGDGLSVQEEDQRTAATDRAVPESSGTSTGWRYNPESQKCMSKRGSGHALRGEMAPQLSSLPCRLVFKVSDADRRRGYFSKKRTDRAAQVGDIASKGNEATQNSVRMNDRPSGAVA